MKKMMTGVLALVMVLVMVGCGQKDNGVVNGVAKDGATIGEGAKSFTTEVVDKDGGKVTFTVKTDADTVGKALLDQKNVELRGCPRTCAILGEGVQPACEADWDTEFGDYILAVKVVKDAGNGWYEITFSGPGGRDTTGYMKGDYLTNS